MISHIGSQKQSTCAFTIVRNEPVFLPLWISHHIKTFDRLYVLFHQSASNLEKEICEKNNVESLIIHNSSSYCWAWITETANEFSRFLLKSFNVVAYSDVDELIIDTNNILHSQLPGITRCQGYAIHQIMNEEAPLVTNLSISAQRNHYTDHSGNSKPIIRTDPTPDWDMGFHYLRNHPYIPINPLIFLIHLHFIDYDIMLKRHQLRGQFNNISEFEASTNSGGHNFLHKAEDIRNFLTFWEGYCSKMTPTVASIVDKIDLSTLGVF